MESSSPQDENHLSHQVLGMVGSGGILLSLAINRVGEGNVILLHHSAMYET